VFTCWPYVLQLDLGHTYDEHLILAFKLGVTLYVSAMYLVVSRALVVEKEDEQMGSMAKQQYPIYFVSEVLVGSKNITPRWGRFAR
jgi:hypothetical protein